MFPRKSPAFVLWLGGLLTGCLLAPVSAAHAGWADSIQNFLDRAGLFQGVRASGQNTLTLQRNFLQGSQAAFEGQRWDTGDFYRQSSLHLEGPIWKEFGFQADLSASGWGQNYTRWVLGYVGHDTAFYYGDLNVSLPGNEFATFSKSLQGYQVDQALPNKGLLRAFYSKEKGYTRNETTQGNNTSGPYFLTYTPIIEGSLHVKVDELVLQLGTDYRVDYQTGELWFEPTTGPPRIIPSTSTISASYQSLGYSTDVGTLSGLRAEMPLRHERGVVGLTVLRQNRPEVGRGDNAARQEDIYEGSGTTGPFDTNYRPILEDGATVVYKGVSQTIDNPLIVIVDTVTQIEGVDYDSYRDLGRIIFRRLVPPTSLVRISYYYNLGATASPNLQLLAADLSYRLTPDLLMVTQFAQSQGGTGGGTGTALSGLLSYQRPNLQVTTEYRSMTPNYSYVDSSGFYKQETGLRTSLDWRVNRYLSLYDTFSSMRGVNGLAFGYSGYPGSYAYASAASGPGARQITPDPPAMNVQTLTHSLGLRYQRPNWPTLELSRDSMSNTSAELGSSSYQTDTLAISHDFGPKLRTQAQWRINSQSSLPGASSSLQWPSNSRSNQGTFSVTWRPSDTLSLTTNLDTTRATGTTSESGASGVVATATSARFSGRWAPTNRLSLDVEHTASRSRGTAGGGYYATSGSLPYTLAVAQAQARLAGATGWPSPLQTTPGEVAELEDTHTFAGLNYQFSDRLAAGVNWGTRKYLSGGGLGYLADSQQTTQNFTLTWRFSPTLSLSGSLGTDRLEFLQAGRGSVSNDTYAASINYQPLNTPWGLGVTLNRQTGASPTYIDIGSHQHYLMVPTDLSDLSAQIRYRVGNNSNLFTNVGMSSFSSGYSAFTKNTAEIGLQHELSDTTHLDFSYRLIHNLGGTPSSPLYSTGDPSAQNYLANTFALTLNTSFGSGSSGGGFNAPSGGGGYGGFSSFGSTGLASFGGYQTGFSATPTRAGSTGFPTAGLGAGAFENSGSGSRARYNNGFPTGSGGPQGVPGEGMPPALDWGAPLPGQPSGPQPPTTGAPGRWDEGLSRWDFANPGKWW